MLNPAGSMRALVVVWAMKEMMIWCLMVVSRSIDNGFIRPSGAAFRELGRSFLKFGEVYERIESSKQQQMMELERQRMEFTKDLEFQRIHMFIETLLEIKKMKRPKYGSRTGIRRLGCSQIQRSREL